MRSHELTRIHSAGLAHGMSGLPEDDYRAINTEATVGLARAAARVGVRRFVFLSPIRAQSGPLPAAKVLPSFQQSDFSRFIVHPRVE